MTDIRVPGRNVTVGEAVKKLNPHVFGQSATTEQKVRGQAGDVKPVETAPIQSPEEKLNKLERRWLAVLRGRWGSQVGIQRMTLKLSNRVKYTPDFDVSREIDSGDGPMGCEVTFYETKGPHRFREKGILKLKWAAKEYPHFDFVLVTYDKDGGWKEELIAKE